MVEVGEVCRRWVAVLSLELALKVDLDSDAVETHQAVAVQLYKVVLVELVGMEVVG